MRTLDITKDRVKVTDPNRDEAPFQDEHDPICTCPECEGERMAIIPTTPFGLMVYCDEYDRYLEQTALEDSYSYSDGTSSSGDSEEGDGTVWVIIRWEDGTEDSGSSGDSESQTSATDVEDHSGWGTGDPDLGSSSSWMDGQSGQEGSGSAWQDSSSFQNPDDGYGDNGSFTDDSHAWS